MNLSLQVEETLKALAIPFEIVEHPPALTTAEADSFITGIEGVRTKSMFLTNKKKTAYYLLIMDDEKRLDMDKFKEIVGANRIKMASTDSLMEQLQLPPGVVSVFGLLNNTKKNVQVFFDTEILDKKKMSFHPNVNTKTIFLSTKDVLKFVNAIGFEYTIIDL
ncbi:prolyl-tRNA synthetase associated domain-containing protein [Enterococcus sp. MJM12]|uniref:Prolyl-tRNA synthetase associated domain-containing protein n=1 Tax=Candidatus Enterococcus myersii TaxID=2815322 RepID=A0ABS3H686_9ENTE|nr:prolyl-tRNA synthetase associated domain-containing protein [Enterococcus sp. MJM12]MBO0448643.1 prolyl-tRNA synthetase associated domain-containing protein [Enterococcus sp. MJM12]